MSNPNTSDLSKAETVTDDPCHEVAQALRAIGLRVEPAGDELSLWHVDDEEMTDAGLMKLAVLLELVPGSAMIQ
ncbi:hypothetical protein MKK70_05835 [Methylobacterium sp. E-041]|uniref:hypothetical protein n=1 Tax=Methylobacterium sp. E-041 TaxID=2836573 RepID=UPI001FBAFC45|nr:hypothetical protein [Methylobacterium sp. E-041]MCJ2104907.1 hypothetical protein [Methylobacterium sp. E-041]